MAFTHLVAHRIQRLVPSEPAKSILRDEELPREGTTEESIREMKLSFVKKLTKIHGQFSPDTASHPISEWARQYLEGKSSFVSFTRRSMQQFEQALAADESLIDAYVFFVQEKLQQSEDIYIFIVHHRIGQYLDSDLNVSNAQVLDTDNVNLAVRINLTEWQDDDPHLSYLSVLVWRGEKELNEAFMQWIGFTNKANIKEQTDAFIEVVEDYVSQKPAPVAFETREKVVDYCIQQDKAGKRVDLKELSEQINTENDREFVQFVKEKQPKLESELIPDRSQLRNYIRLSGRNDLVSMSFDSKCLGESIIYDPESDSLIINTIPAGLKTRLMKHLSKPSSISD